MKKKLISSLIVVISTAALLMGCSQKVERVSRDTGDTAGGAEQAVEQSDVNARVEKALASISGNDNRDT